VEKQPYPTDIKDNEWEILVKLLPSTKRTGRPRKYSYRDIINAIYYVLNNGIKWRAMPHDLPHWKTVYHYFRSWQQQGYWQRWHTLLREQLRLRYGRQAQASAGVLDSQSMKTAEGGKERGFDANKRCVGRKRHILVDSLGLLLMVVVTAANVQDRDGARIVLGRFFQVFFQSFRFKLIWADGGYQGALIDWVKEAFAWSVVIIKRHQDVKGFKVLPRRWVVERTFSWFIRNRRLCRDYERLPQSAEAFIYIAMIRLMTRRLAGLNDF